MTSSGAVAVEEETRSGGKGWRPFKRYFPIRVEGERDHGFIDWDDRDSWPRNVFEFLHAPVRFVEKTLFERSVEKMPCISPPPLPIPPVNDGVFSTGHFLHADSEVRGENQTPAAATDLVDAGTFSTESPGLRARGDGSSGVEGEPKGLGSTDTSEQPPEDEGLSDFSHHYFGKPRINPEDGAYTPGGPPRTS